MKWIKSSEQLPKKNKSVLVCLFLDDKPRKIQPIGITYYNENGWNFYDENSDFNKSVKVKYWMELPSLP